MVTHRRAKEKDETESTGKASSAATSFFRPSDPQPFYDQAREYGG